MQVLVVHAHPEPQSFCSAMARLAVEVMESVGHSVRVSDLYARGFNPVASAADFGNRSDPAYLNYAIEQRRGVDDGSIAEDIQLEVGKVQQADLLLLIFPTYWFSMPAMLKGWIDRVFVSGLFYGGKRFYERGGLCGKRAAVAVTLGGRPHMFGHNAIHGDLQTMLRPLIRGTLSYVGYEVLPPFFGYHIPYINADQRNAVMEGFKRWVVELDTAQPLKFPRLTEFDDALYPVGAARRGDSVPYFEPV